MSRSSICSSSYCASFAAALVAFVLLGCEGRPEVSSIDPVNWKTRTTNLNPTDSLTTGSTYLPVYSQVYSRTEHVLHDLTVTVSIHNINRADTVYLKRADYYNTAGNRIRSYFESNIYIAPLETVEIVINEVDREGGSGANFVFDWMTHPGDKAPLFDAIMISTSAQQGLSFSTRGVAMD